MENKDVQSENIQQEENISVCDIMKEDTSEIIRKIESKMPSVFQRYSDMYSKYLHTLDDVFGTCYIAEKEYFDKLNLDQGFLRAIKQNSELMKKNYVECIDVTAKFFDQYVQMRMTAMESFDDYIHVMMGSYAKTLSQFNNSAKPSF